MPEEQRAPDSPISDFTVGTWTVNPDLDEIHRDGERVKLEPRTMQLLLALAKDPGKVVSTRQLLDTVWSGVVVGSASVYQAVSQLRKLLHDTDPEPTYIATIPRKGYRLVATVTRSAGSGTATVAPRNRSLAFRVWAAGLVIAVIAGVATWRMTRQSADTVTSATIPVLVAELDNRTIAVLPLEAATQDAPSQSLAPIVTDLLRTRLANVDGLVVIAAGSTSSAMEMEKDFEGIGRRLRARHLLRGTVAQTGNQVHIQLALVDASSGGSVWKSVFHRAVGEIGMANEDVVRHVARSLQLAAPPVNTAAAKAPIDVAAYQLYLEGQKLITTYRAADAEKASAVFRRVTTLDPDFARGYYALAQALLLSADLGARAMSPEIQSDASQSLDRALKQNPALGEALALRARLTQDPEEAEKLYRRALQLAPGHDESYLRYSDFLFTQRRRGEAISLIERAQHIDPLSAPLCWRMAQLMIVNRGDVAAQQEQLRRALAIKPDFPTGLRELAISQWSWRGEFANALYLSERAIAVDRLSERADWIAGGIYLDAGDPVAATHVLGEVRRPKDFPARGLEGSIALYQGDNRKAATIAEESLRELLASQPTAAAFRNDLPTYSVSQELYGWYWQPGLALRDEALRTGDYSAALDLVGRYYELRAGNSPLRARGAGLAYAHLLILAGRERQGRELLTAMLDTMEAEQAGRPPDWFSWERASALAMLGEDEKALGQLEASMDFNRYNGWWYTSARDPVFDRIRPSPRFQALVKRAAQHRTRQRELLEELRRTNEVPRRS